MTLVFVSSDPIESKTFDKSKMMILVFCRLFVNRRLLNQAITFVSRWRTLPSSFRDGECVLSFCDIEAKLGGNWQVLASTL